MYKLEVYKDNGQVEITKAFLEVEYNEMLDYINMYKKAGKSTRIWKEVLI